MSTDSEFSLNDVFFSRTDKRGVIQSGNDTFQRVSEFDWEDLLGAPHKVVRHADMPKAVFQLIWDTLKSGQPVGAYIKNQRKTGSGYWVFAYITPIEGGYLSVRYKPSTEKLEKIEAIYAELVEYESEADVTPEMSKIRLEERIQDIGYADYEQFSLIAMAEELQARQKALNFDPFKPALHLEHGMENWSTIPSHCRDIMSDYTTISETSQNLQIQAVHLGATGRSLAVISEQFRQSAMDMNNSLTKFIKESRIISALIERAAFSMSAASIILEVEENFDAKTVLESEQATKQEFQILQTIRKDYERIAKENVDELFDKVSQFISLCTPVRQQITSLSVTRIMCQIETAPLGQKHRGITGAIEELENFTERSGSTIDQVGHALKRVEINLKECIKAMTPPLAA